MRNMHIAFVVTTLACVASAQQQAVLHANDAALSDCFGKSVAISGTTVLVGADKDTITDYDQGSAYVFTASGGSWSQQAKLVPTVVNYGIRFGFAVSLSGNTAAVGAPTSGVGAGAAYVFVRSGTTWTQQALLTATGGAAADILGFSISLDGNTLAVGAPRRDEAGIDSGAAYVFVRTGTTWAQQAKLLPSAGASNALFGTSVSLQGDTLVVGASQENGVSPRVGSVYVFQRSGTAWSQQARLSAADAAEGDGFGGSVSLAGDAVVVGAGQRDQQGMDSGACYVFGRTGAVWNQQAKLVASDPARSAYFGRAVSMISGTILVGASQGRAAGLSAGSAYVFVGAGANWTEGAKFASSSPANLDHFGNSVALSGATAVIGAPFNDELAWNAGSATTFWVTPPGAPFCAGDGTLATACPCGNSGAAGRGCENSQATGGARLDSQGVASLSADTVALQSSGELPTSSTVFLQGSTAVSAGIVFGDGLRCVGGALKRIGIHGASSGTVSYPIAGDASISARSAILGDLILPGQARYYQAYYRDPNPAFCPDPPGNGWNVSSGQIVTWWP